MDYTKQALLEKRLLKVLKELTEPLEIGEKNLIDLFKKWVGNQKLVRILLGFWFPFSTQTIRQLWKKCPIIFIGK
jgi:hypothetical protein